MAHWIDNADSYVCPVCRFETDNPNKFHERCPKCGFMDPKDAPPSLEEKIQILTQAVDTCLSVALITAPAHYRTHLEYLKENISEVLEGS